MTMKHFVQFTRKVRIGFAFGKQYLLSDLKEASYIRPKREYSILWSVWLEGLLNKQKLEIALRNLCALFAFIRKEMCLIFLYREVEGLARTNWWISFLEAVIAICRKLLRKILTWN